MQASDLIIEVRDATLARVAQIAPEHIDLTATLRDCGVGDWTLRLPADHLAATHLRAPGAGIIVVSAPTGQALFSGPVSTFEDAAEAADPEGVAKIVGVTDEILLWNRIVYPSPTEEAMWQRAEQWEYYGPAADAVCALVQAQLGTGTFAERRVPNLVIQGPGSLGPVNAYRSRLDVVGDVAAAICSAAELRFTLTQGAADTKLYFDVAPVADRRSRVEFSVPSGSLSTSTTVSSAPGATRAIVGGQGEGIGRTLLECTTPEAEAAETAWGPWGRIEQFVDQRNTNDYAELTAAGRQTVEAAAAHVAASVVADDALTLALGQTWWIGDAVSVVVGGDTPQEARYSARITEVRFEVTAATVRAGAVLGPLTALTPLDAVERRTADVERRLSALERYSGNAVASAEYIRAADVPTTVSGRMGVSYARTSAGIVVLGGTVPGTWRTDVVRPSGSHMNTLMVLPEGYRPAYTHSQVVTVYSGGTTPRARAGTVIVFPNGYVRLQVSSMYSDGYLSLDGVMFPAADIATEDRWQPITLLDGATAQTSAAILGGALPEPGMFEDRLGRLWFRGRVLFTPTGSQSTGRDIVRLSSFAFPPVASKYSNADARFPCDHSVDGASANDQAGISYIRMRESGGRFTLTAFAEGGTQDAISLTGVVLSGRRALVTEEVIAQADAFGPGWKSDGSPTVRATRFPDGLTFLDGVAYYPEGTWGGANPSGTLAMTIPAALAPPTTPSQGWDRASASGAVAFPVMVGGSFNETAMCDFADGSNGSDVTVRCNHEGASKWTTHVFLNGVRYLAAS